MPLPARLIGDQVFSRVAGAPLVGGNSVRLLRDSTENYPAWLDTIATARRFIHLENYLIRNDETGRRFADALVRKAAEGVAVRVIYDWIGSFGLSMKGFWRRLRAAGVEIRAYNTPRLDEPLGWVIRDHRKCIVVDGAVAFVTGLCLAKAWEGDKARGIPPWRDTGIEIRGPAVADVAAAFADSWAATGPALSASTDAAGAEPGPVAGDIALRVVASTPGIASLYRLDPLVASMARRTLWLTDAYFAGTAGYVQSLRAAAQDGVDVRILVPGSGSDLPLMQAVSRAGYRALLEGGIRVFEWNGVMLHAKTAVADARWARVGSTNLNLLSWVGNRELDVVIEDQGFGRQMEEMFESDLQNSTEIVLRRWSRVGAATSADSPRKRRTGAGSARAAAGAMRIGNALGAVLAARRVHAPAERRLMFQGGLLLLVVSGAGLFWPRLLAWPLGVLSLWMGLALLFRAVRPRKRAPEALPPRPPEQPPLPSL